MEILSNFQNVKSRCANVKHPMVKTLWRWFWFNGYALGDGSDLMDMHPGLIDMHSPH